MYTRTASRSLIDFPRYVTVSHRLTTVPPGVRCISQNPQVSHRVRTVSQGAPLYPDESHGIPPSAHVIPRCPAVFRTTSHGILRYPMTFHGIPPTCVCLVLCEHSHIVLSSCSLSLSHIKNYVGSLNISLRPLSIENCPRAAVCIGPHFARLYLFVRI